MFNYIERFDFIPFLQTILALGFNLFDCHLQK
jgi:hypothetical protein